MVEYRQELSPIYECTGFIERYINQSDDYQKLQESCKEQDKELIQELVSVSNVLGKAFDEHFAKDRFLFTFLHENQAVSPICTLLFLSSDDQQRTLKETFDHMRKMIQKDPCIFIKEIIYEEKGCQVDEEQEDALLAMIDELHLEDGIKWKLWQLHRHLFELVEKLEEIMKVMLPIYHRFDTLYEKFLLLYQQELNAQEDMYEYAMEQLHIDIAEEQVIILPVISCMRSLSFLSKKREDHSSYLLVYWGVCTMQRLRKEKDIIDEENMCSALKLLSDRSKFDILRFISNQKAYGAQIANELHLSTPTISYHMQSLLNAKLVSFQKENNRLYYRLNKDYLKELFYQIYEQLTNG